MASDNSWHVATIVVVGADRTGLTVAGVDRIFHGGLTPELPLLRL